MKRLVALALVAWLAYYGLQMKASFTAALHLRSILEAHMSELNQQ